MKYRPSPCVTVSYEVPDGSCTAVTVAPGMTPPCASLTIPVTEAVVTPCAYAELMGPVTAHDIVRSASIRPVRPRRAARDLFTCFIAHSCSWMDFAEKRVIVPFGYDGPETKK